MPPKDTNTSGAVYHHGKKLMDFNGSLPELEELTPLVKPIGDYHSVPHYRCGRCRCAVVVYENDSKPDKCPWCGVGLDWRNENEENDRSSEH